jgi:hypothetical protein
MTGAEYLTAVILESRWDEMAAAFHDERSRSRLGTQDLLKRWSPARVRAWRTDYAGCEIDPTGALPEAVPTWTSPGARIPNVRRRCGVPRSLHPHRGTWTTER